MKNPEQIKETWLNRIENGKSREIAREFFYTYTTQEEIKTGVEKTGVEKDGEKILTKIWRQVCKDCSEELLYLYKYSVFL